MYLYNIDTLSFALDYKDYNDFIINYIDELQRKKDIARVNKSDFNNEKSLIEINGLTFEVMPNGSQGYAFILHNSDYEIQLSAVRSKNKDNYPVFIKIKQAALWALGVKNAYNNILFWLKDVFAFPIAEKINRVDICCHTDMINFSNYDCSYFKSRANKKCNRYNGSVINGFEFGVRTGLIYCRIYNKVLEVTEKKSKMWFFDIWEKHNANTNNIWNVEFELKRDFLREYNIETLNDFLVQSKSIWQYLTKQWIVLTLNDCSRLENSTVLNEWLELSNGFLEFGNKQFIRKENQLNADKQSIVAQTFGYIRSYAAFDNITNLGTALELLSADLYIYANEKGKDFASLVSEKSSLYVRGCVNG